MSKYSMVSDEPVCAPNERTTASQVDVIAISCLIHRPSTAVVSRFGPPETISSVVPSEHSIHTRKASAASISVEVSRRTQIETTGDIIADVSTPSSVVQTNPAVSWIKYAWCPSGIGPPTSPLLSAITPVREAALLGRAVHPTAVSSNCAEPHRRYDVVKPSSLVPPESTTYVDVLELLVLGMAQPG